MGGYIALNRVWQAKGYWTADHVVDHTRYRKWPSPQSTFSNFEEPFSAKQFSPSSTNNRGAFAKDALVASNLNLQRGGKQPKMRDGFILHMVSDSGTLYLCFIRISLVITY